MAHLLEHILAAQADFGITFEAETQLEYMLFQSTRSKTGQKRTTLADAVMMGLAEDGGLFMPESISVLDKSTLQQFPEMSLPEIAATILSQLLGNDIDKPTMNAICEKVFESTDQSVGWDGTFTGRLAEPGVFVFYLTTKCAEEPEIFKKGNVTVIR